MSDRFQQTVDLKERLKRPNTSRPKPGAARPVQARPAAPKLAAGIDEVYGPSDNETENQDLKSISRPPARENSAIWRSAGLVAVLTLIIVGAVYFSWRRPASPEAGPSEPMARWYAIKLITGETFYGQVPDPAADPIVVNDVYYNYDQLNAGGQTDSAPGGTGNLKLVKRGKETHGPDGSMDIIRSQVVYLEPLKEDSKVLRAILNNEGL